MSDAKEPAERLASGTAWDELCEALRRTGHALLAEDAARDPRMHAEGFRHLAGLVVSGLRQALELADPERPRWLRNPDSAAKWGAENADNQYLWARVDPKLRYRIRGQRCGAFDFLIEAKQGYMQLGDTGNYATLTAGQIACEPDGSFEVTVSAAPAPGNWLRLDPAARYLLVRQYFWDWQHESPARFEIACLDAAGAPPPEADPGQVAAQLASAGEWVERTFRCWNQWVAGLRAEHRPGEIAAAVQVSGGADDIRYGNDLYRVAPDEALVIESELPRARYWSFQLCSLWFETLDYANRQTSLNGHQAHVDSDGRLRCVVAHRDPGVPNWLDASGHAEGMIQYRFVWSETSPHPTLRTLPFARLHEVLPADTPTVTPEQRRASIAVRQEHVARREPAS